MAIPNNASLQDTVPVGRGACRMPRLGFGVYKIPPHLCKSVCLDALQVGYRHIDCAQLYKSEAQVGAAVTESSIHRSEIFLTTKIKQWRGGPEDLRRSLLDSVQALGGGPDGYVDLFLIHTPRFRTGTVKEVWIALEELRAQGKAKAIGVSNFTIAHLEDMKEYAETWPPSVNQIERQLVQYCEDHNILVQAYSPLATGARLNDPTLSSIATRLGKSPALVLIRYSLQKGWVPLPKSQDAQRMRENAQVFDFELNDTDMSALDELDEGKDGARFPANAT